MKHDCSKSAGMCGPWSDVKLNLMQNFYQPDYAGNPGTDIDREVAETVPCERCAKVACRYEAWANSGGGYGVAVAICKSCDHAMLF